MDPILTNKQKHYQHEMVAQFNAKNGGNTSGENRICLIMLIINTKLIQC